MSQFREFAGQVVRALPDDIGEDVMQCWIQNPRALREALRDALAPLANLAEFFRTRTGLWVSADFRERILAPALAGGSVTPAAVGKHFDLSESMNDAEIRGKLGDGHTFENPRAFCLYLAGALGRQWGGKAGDLPSNGYASLFYVRGANGAVFAVFVRWYARVGVWGVDAYRLVAHGWRAGSRAFPCNC